MTNELYLKYPKPTEVIIWECACEGDFYEQPLRLAVVLAHPLPGEFIWSLLTDPQIKGRKRRELRSVLLL